MNISMSVDSSGANASKAWPMGTVIGVSLSLVLFAALVVIMLWFTAQGRSELPAEGKTPEQKLQELRAQDHMTLSNYGWIDRAKGIVRIPIDRAMTIMVEESNADSQPQPAQIPTKDSQP